MKKLLLINIVLLLFVFQNDLQGQKLSAIKFSYIEPFRPIPIQNEIFLTRIPRPEMINGKIAFVLENEEDYNRRVDEQKEKDQKVFLNSAIYKQWLKEHLEWRKKTPNWQKETRYPDLVNDIQPKLIPKLGEAYQVTSKSLNIRSESNKASSIVYTLKQGDEITLLNANNRQWWYIRFNEYKGYVFAESLKLNPYSGWDKKSYQTGTTPECENVVPKYDYNLDNYLRINVGSGTDVVVKLMKIGVGVDECIRIVFVRSQDTYDIKNIPEGKYYVKIAYGKDYRQKIVDNICYVKFVQSPLYEKGKDILDYNRVEKPDTKVGNQTYRNWLLPSFELSLDIIQSNFNRSTFKSDGISEAEFNN
ncbi:MAG: SH3 domain-containing protein [Sediminibacterium sp.]